MKKVNFSSALKGISSGLKKKGQEAKSQNHNSPCPIEAYI